MKSLWSKTKICLYCRYSAMNLFLFSKVIKNGSQNLRISIKKRNSLANNLTNFYYIIVLWINPILSNLRNYKFKKLCLWDCEYEMAFLIDLLFPFFKKSWLNYLFIKNVKFQNISTVYISFKYLIKYINITSCLICKILLKLFD